MILTTLATAWTLATLGQQPKLYQDRETGFSLPYPATWEFRKERLYSVFSIPLSSGQKAEVQVINTPFRGQASAWQVAQAEVAKTLNRTVDRQWEEVILGVPLLMTRLTFEQDKVPSVTLVGLIYSRNPVKLSYRMTTSAEAFPEAEAKWREALNGIRTLSGSLPASEDPTQPAAQPEVRTPDSPRITVMRPPQPEKARPSRRDQLVPMEVLGQNLQLRVPRGWTVAKGDRGFTLTHRDLKGTLSLDYGSGQINDMIRAVQTTSSSLNTRFQSVSLREEGQAGTNRSGAARYRISRRGTDKEGSLFSHAMGGHAGLHYWVTLYTAQDDKTMKRDLKLMEELHESLLLSPSAP